MVRYVFVMHREACISQWVTGRDGEVSKMPAGARWE
jgi:hypothetical protein